MQLTRDEWDEFIKGHSRVHLLQSGAWGELKRSFGWYPVRVQNGVAGAQILFRSLAAGLTIGYIPKGPVGCSEQLLDEIDQVCLKNKAIFLKVEPDSFVSDDFANAFKKTGWVSSEPVQPQTTSLVSLVETEEEILAEMKQKTRYNIRLAEKKGVVVRPSDDIDSFYCLVKETGGRDSFGIHVKAYYQKVYDLFHPSGNCELLMAFYNEKPLAGLFVCRQGQSAYYMYGASSNDERNRMPAYLIQWAAIKWAKEKGCVSYDLWGVPDMPEENLEEAFLEKQSHEGLWGVYRFKRGFGGSIVHFSGAYDRVYRRGLYRLYKLVMQIKGKHAE